MASGLVPIRQGVAMIDPDRPPLEQPLAELERQLISAYVTETGHDFHELMARTDDEARGILAAAARHASHTLSEVEARAHYLQTLREHV
jgi:hypothetical protein